MHQHEDQSHPTRPSRQQEFNIALVKMVVLACCAVMFDTVGLLGMFLSYGGAELAVAMRMRSLRAKEQG